MIKVVKYKSRFKSHQSNVWQTNIVSVFKQFIFFHRQFRIYLVSLPSYLLRLCLVIPIVPESQNPSGCDNHTLYDIARNCRGCCNGARLEVVVGHHKQSTKFVERRIIADHDVAEEKSLKCCQRRKTLRMTYLHETGEANREGERSFQSGYFYTSLP